MFSRKFWRDAADSFLLAVAVVAVTDAHSLVEAGSIGQLEVAALAVGRAAVIAGFAAVAPRIVALRDKDSGEVVAEVEVEDV